MKIYLVKHVGQNKYWNGWGLNDWVQFYELGPLVKFWGSRDRAECELCDKLNVAIGTTFKFEDFVVEDVSGEAARDLVLSSLVLKVYGEDLYG